MRLVNKILLISILGSFPSMAENLDEPLAANEGYVILPLVISGTLPKSVHLGDSKTFGDNHKMNSLKIGQNYELIRFPEGEYKWTKIKLNDSYYFNLEKQNFSITVKRGVINYSGHLLIDINSRYGTAKYNYVNRSSQVLDELERCCNKLANKFKLIFTGKSEDPFLDFYKAAIKDGDK